MFSGKVRHPRPRCGESGNGLHVVLNHVDNTPGAAGVFLCADGPITAPRRKGT